MGKVKIDLGYGDSLQTVFEGIVFERDLKIERLMKGAMSVSCLDGKALFRLNNAFLSHPPVKSHAELVKKIASKYDINLKIDATPNFAKPSAFNQKGATDFDFIVKAAQNTGFEFFVLSRDLYFRKPGKEKLITLEKEGLYGLQYRTSMAGIYSEMELMSYNQDKEEEKKVSAKSPKEKTGKGSTGADILQKNKKSLVLCDTIYINNITERDLQVLLDARMRENSMKLTELTLRTDGLPELEPGKLLTLSKIGEGLDNDYYVHTVRHHFNANEYRTELVCHSNTAM
jgi:phage protein D